MQRTVYKHLDGEGLEVILFCFPSKTTHRLQPLDVGVFNKVQRYWKTECQKARKGQRDINRHTIIPTYVHATRDAMDPTTIKKAFKNTGIFPINRDIFTAEDFAPSQATSSHANVLDTYPPEIRSSSPFVPSDAESDSDYQQESDEHEEGSDEFYAIAGSSSNNNDNSPEIEIEGSPTQPNTPSQPRSGLLSSLSSIDETISHLTRSSTAYLRDFSMAPPKHISLEED